MSSVHRFDLWEGDHWAIVFILVTRLDLLQEIIISFPWCQVVAACQFVYEEKFIAKYNVHPLKVVGNEGIFGFFILIIVQLVMYAIGPVPDGFQFGYNPKGLLEDPLGKNISLSLTFPPSTKIILKSHI